MPAGIIKPRGRCDPTWVIKCLLRADDAHNYFSSPDVKTHVDNNTGNTSMWASGFPSGQGGSVASPKGISSAR